ncbi:hypothetical protein NEIMUCOT_04207 [Neisseria mucosa ATCC 25996]|uniref:Uncharacterized protein n=1 Tax=Neisseria mucosa (strain ATCC 25996 / DSM 4631 / NCTC 10774 / M26) TaxID=546266 RepID=D2ZUB9_NEIM2|nr:hypothetical protein NEIMUCOT_04207 [Neisseria mucosa ATCC 25996]
MGKGSSENSNGSFQTTPYFYNTTAIVPCLSGVGRVDCRI